LQRALADAGFTEPRPIQSATLPEALAGRDILGLSQTGSGKTAAFALPILARLAETRGTSPRALILAPTRELAAQIQEHFQELAHHTRVSVVTVFGGVSMNTQISALRARPDIVVACPGRLLDLLQRGQVDLRRVEMLVLDEADHMFDLGFLPDVRRILAALPAKRQNFMFSATMPPPIRLLADRLLQRPHVVELTNSQPASTIAHALCPIEETRKLDLLRALIARPDFKSAIVFSRTKRRTKVLADRLAKLGHRAIALQGNMSQPQRVRAMQGFQTGRFNILVATDVAARGIDVAGISHVINFDVPSTPETYTHRIGRTGRSECTGQAFTFVTSADTAMVRAIERMLKGPITRETILPSTALPDAGRRGFGAGSPSESERRPAQRRGPARPHSGAKSHTSSQPRRGGASSQSARSHRRPESSGSSHRPQTASAASRHSASRPSEHSHAKPSERSHATPHATARPSAPRRHPAPVSHRSRRPEHSDRR
jgi:ATP-dependent RNA helicase RhlE